MDHAAIIALCTSWWACGTFSCHYWWGRIFPGHKRTRLDTMIIVTAGVGGPATWLALWLEWGEHHP